MNTQKIIELSFSDIPNMLVKGKKYHSPLPADVNDWYCYILDAGHCILSIVKAQESEAFAPGSEPRDYLVAVSVKAVLRDYKIRESFVIANVEYDDDIGVIDEFEDDEF